MTLATTMSRVQPVRHGGPEVVGAKVLARDAMPQLRGFDVVFAGLLTITTARLRAVLSQTHLMRDSAGAQACPTAGCYPAKLVLIPSEPHQ